MNDIVTNPLTMDGKDPGNLRGDPIPQERYYSREFMRQEWDGLWTKIWHIAGREQQLPEPGDYIVHDFMHESVVILRQQDGSLKGFYNACGHRGMRLVFDHGSQDALHCQYHDWKWRIDGSLEDCPDRDDFPQGVPLRQGDVSRSSCGYLGGSGLVHHGSRRASADGLPASRSRALQEPSVRKSNPHPMGARGTGLQLEVLVG